MEELRGITITQGRNYGVRGKKRDNDSSTMYTVLGKREERIKTYLGMGTRRKCCVGFSLAMQEVERVYE